MTSFAPLDQAPLTVAPVPAIDREPVSRRRLRSDRLATQPTRERRTGLDGLAIGAPLTAAFVGVLLAEADLVAGREAGMADAGATPVRPHGLPGSSDVQAGATTSVAAAMGGGATSLASDTTSSAASAIDPVAVTDPGTPRTSGSGGGGEGPGPVAVGQPAAVATGAVVAGGLTLNVGGAGAVGGVSGDANDGAGTGDEGGTIGDFVAGSDGDDVIHGTPYDDHLSGGDGDDTIYGYAGDDQLFGEAGNDTLHGGEGDDLLDGGIGDDQLFGGPGDDQLLGADGDDQLDGGTGSDWLDGGAGDDLVDGGEDNDRLIGGTGNDELIVDDIHDIALEYDRGADGGGIDQQTVDAGFADSLPPGTDEATFVFSENLGTGLPEDAAPYRQQVGLEIEHLTLQGTAGLDVIGDSGDNELIGNAGDNALYGMAGDDILAGNEGRDRLDGGAGADRLDGGADDDILSGGDGADELYGSGGDDTYVLDFYDSGVEAIYDHEGVNQLRLEGADEVHVQTEIQGDDLWVFTYERGEMAVIDGYVGHEANWTGIELGGEIVGFDDLMVDDDPTVDVLQPYLTRTGTRGDDTMVGSDRDDWLSGLRGDDHLQGRDGHDVLEGGAGNDELEGGAGDDRYIFNRGEAGVDTIRDGEGVNMAEVRGFDGDMATAKVDSHGNLEVTIDYAPIFTVENFADNPDSFEGIQLGDTFHSTQDLLS